MSFFGSYKAASLSRRSSGTSAMPRFASRGFEERLETSALVSMTNNEVLPTCGRPTIPVFINDDFSVGRENAELSMINGARFPRAHRGLKRPRFLPTGCARYACD